MSTELAQFIDQASLSPDATRMIIDRAARDATKYGFRGLVVPTCSVAQAKRALGEGPVKVVAAIAFPHGSTTADVKVNEAARAAALGADEIDYVINIGAAVENDFHFITQEAAAIVRAVRGRLVKAILEISYLSDSNRLAAAQACVDGGVHYIKTCTGFGPGAVTGEEVRALARALEGKALIKAAGGIREKWQAVEMLKAGAAVIGTSRGPFICSS
jgi:deoxyribose-phosphate aldolase